MCRLNDESKVKLERTEYESEIEVLYGSNVRNHGHNERIKVNELKKR